MILNIDNKTKHYLNNIVTFFKIADNNIYNDIILYDPDMTEILKD